MRDRTARGWRRRKLGPPTGRQRHLSYRRQRQYEAALDCAAAVTAGDAGRYACNWWGERAPLIHQLGIVAPERSKYDSATRTCVPMFDHYCTFLRNPVGRDNYCIFFGTILASGASCAVLFGSCVTLLETGKVEGAVVLAMCAAIYFGAFAAMWVFMIAYHLFLAKVGLTSHELMLLRNQLPGYLADQKTGEYFNPYDHGFLKNMCGKLFPERGAST